MFNNRLLSLFALAGMTSIAASPLSAYSVQGNAPGLGAAIGDAITKALSVVTSGFHVAIVSEHDSASNSYDQFPMESSNGISPVVFVLPDASTDFEPGTLKGTVESVDEFGFKGSFTKSSVKHAFTVTYDSKTVDEKWITTKGAASFVYFDESQFKDGVAWSIDSSKAVIGAKTISVPLKGHRCGDCRKCSFKCPIITGPLEKALTQGYPIDGSGSWSTV